MKIKGLIDNCFDCDFIELENGGINCCYDLVFGDKVKKYLKKSDIKVYIGETTEVIKGKIPIPDWCLLEDYKD